MKEAFLILLGVILGMIFITTLIYKQAGYVTPTKCYDRLEQEGK